MLSASDLDGPRRRLRYGGLLPSDARAFAAALEEAEAELALLRAEQPEPVSLWPPPAGQQLREPDRCGGSGFPPRPSLLLSWHQLGWGMCTCCVLVSRVTAAGRLPVHPGHPRLRNTSSSSRRLRPPVPKETPNG
jgi:hypothetical protein